MKKLKRFTAQWCQPCQTLKKSLEALDLTDVDVEVIDVDTFAYPVYNTPTTPATGTILASYSYVEEGQVRIGQSL